VRRLDDSHERRGPEAKRRVHTPQMLQLPPESRFSHATLLSHDPNGIIALPPPYSVVYRTLNRSPYIIAPGGGPCTRPSRNRGVQGGTYGTVRYVVFVGVEGVRFSVLRWIWTGLGLERPVDKRNPSRAGRSPGAREMSGMPKLEMAEDARV
jgi:hypothetical protein